MHESKDIRQRTHDSDEEDKLLFYDPRNSIHTFRRLIGGSQIIALFSTNFLMIMHFQDSRKVLCPSTENFFI